MECKMKFKRETKGTVLYEEIVESGDIALMGSLYIKKTSEIGKIRPDEIQVTVKAI